MGPSALRRVVVGVDGSLASAAALRWAAAVAGPAAATVQAVHVWSPLTFGAGSERSEDEARLELDLTLQYGLGDRPWPVTVVPTVLRGRPGPALVSIAADADLLVVGTHGRGTAGRVLLGSTSQWCVRHAPCPVVVVPLPQEMQAERVTAVGVAG